MNHRIILAIFLFLIAVPSTAAQDTTVSDIPVQAWSFPIGGEPTGVTGIKTSYPTLDDGPIQGLPIGGMGAGSIGRTFNGDFARWHLDIGQHEYETRPANMFSVYVEQDGSQTAQALWTGRPQRNFLSAWQWEYPANGGTYSALFPRAWYEYSGVLPVDLSVEQITPFIPGDYNVSALPTGVFRWTATNPTDAPMTVSILFTFENQDGERTVGHIHHLVDDGSFVGVEMSEGDGFDGTDGDGSTSIAAQVVDGVEVTRFARFNVQGDGADIWGDFTDDGRLNNTPNDTPSDRERSAAGVAATFTLQPGESLTVPFSVAWDLPVMTFGDNTSWYKRYTAQYGRTGDQAFEIARDALEGHEAWRDAVTEWQTPILEDPARPDWYKTALFNELYYLVDGGTAWEHGKVGEPEPEPGYIGRFAYMECFDYPFYNTFDVDFYASFALMQLFPEIEARIVSDFAETVLVEDLEIREVGFTQINAPRKLSGAIPHDLGGPQEDPWQRINFYNWQDVNTWKDLNAKFVLRIYRDAVLLERPELVTAHWDEVQAAMAYLNAMDNDGDSIPENNGLPDQTYDTWPATGVSAYSGGLWLAALAASAEMAEQVGDTAAASAYRTQLEQATSVYQEKLWTGEYFRYDVQSTSIMSDQMAGMWYADITGLTGILPDEQVLSALQTVHDFNVMQYQDGQMGAVNGMTADGEIDRSSEQSQEVWTGTTYMLAAHMLRRGLTEQAWDTAFGVYHVVYEQHALWFRTPEAWNENGDFRASMYMRPLSIWAMEAALKP